MTDQNVIAKQQFGFRPKFTTEYAILDIYEKLINNRDNSLTSCEIFLDLAKAFDTVNHDILLKKLEAYGIRGKALDLIRSYLSNRYQFVEQNGVESVFSLVECGVPQGSILGPLLFLLYINDLPEATSLFVKLYADDTFLCAQNSNIQVLESEVNIEINKVCRWLRANKLSLNISNSKFMILTKKRNIMPIALNINNIALEQCDSYKYLGVVFDKDLNWKSHIEYICDKITRSVGALASLRHRTNLSVLREIYYALINSYARYGIIAWGNASESALHPLNVLLNKAIRIMTFAPFGPLDLNPIYRELEFLNLYQTFQLERGKFMFKKEKNLLPTSIANYFETEVQNEHGYNLRRRRSPTHAFQSKTILGKKSIQNEGKLFWNNLPECLKDLDSPIAFKKLLKKLLMDA